MNEVIIIVTSQPSFLDSPKKLNSFSGLEDFATEDGNNRWFKILTNDICDVDSVTNWQYVKIILTEDKKYEENDYFTKKILTPLLKHKSHIYCVLHNKPEKSANSRNIKKLIESEVEKFEDKKCDFLPQHHTEGSIYFNELITILEKIEDYSSEFDRIIKKFPDHILEADIALKKQIAILWKKKELGDENEPIVQYLRQNEKIKGILKSEDIHSIISEFRQELDNQNPKLKLDNNSMTSPSLKKLIIWDEETSDLIKDFENEANNTIIKTKVQWENFNLNSNKFDAIITLAELNWGSPIYLQDFHGISIAQKLRRDLKCKLPILFVSSLSPNFIQNNDKKKRKIIGAVGHGFFPLNAFFENPVDKVLNEIPDLNELQFSYIKSHHCSVRGTISSRFHDIKNIVRADQKAKKTNDEIIGEINKELEILSQLATAYPAVVKDILEEKISETDENEKQKKINVFLETNESAILRYYPVIDNFEATINEKKPWEILWLEDEDIDENIVKKLNPKGNHETNIIIHHATNFAEAKKIIYEDKYNKITVVIADFRLYKNDPDTVSVYGKNHKEQEKQGYDFLIWLSNQNRFNKLIALSGLSRSFLSEFFRKQNLNVKIYSKNDIVGNGANMFVEDVMEFGDEIFEVICSIPTGSAWEKNYTEWYRHLRLTGNINFDLIDQLCNGFIRRIETLLHYDSKYSTLLKNRGNKTKQGKTSLLLDMFGFDLQIDTGGEYNQTFKLLSKIPPNQISIRQRQFINKLIVRRIAMYLYLKYGYTQEEIAKFFGKGSKYLNNNIGLNIASVPLYILPEEHNWLIDKFDIYNNYNDPSIYFQLFLDEWFDKKKNHLEKLKKDNEIKNEFFEGPNKNNKILVILNVTQGYIIFKKLLQINKNEDRKELVLKQKRLVKLIERNPYLTESVSDIKMNFQKILDMTYNEQ